MEWKGKVIDTVDEKIRTLSNKTSSKFYKSALQQNNQSNTLNDIHNPLNTLNGIHNQFVSIPTEKANGNFALIVNDFMHWLSFYKRMYVCMYMYMYVYIYIYIYISVTYPEFF